ncbi:MAG: ribosomal protein [Thermoleophilia bacterium]|nr:ribosomal protein [Thermoleophilia bacterium]
MARLKDKYNDEIRPALKEELGLDSVMQVPRIEKITLNMGVGDAKVNSKLLDAAVEQLSLIAGQRAVQTKARISVATFKLREGMPIGTKVTLRGERMYEFLDRLLTIALPRIRDFRGIKATAFDKQGNFSLGITEQTIFPEIDYDTVDTTRGLDVVLTIKNGSREGSKALLDKFGMPFVKPGQQA